MRGENDIARFEAAVDAVVDGDVDALRALLAGDPGLVRARSTGRGHATLLHYCAANGVEDERQRTPANVVDMARLLLDAGAEVDAPNDDYGGGGTALGLVASSIHPRRAGVQLALMELLVAAGASIDGLPGGWAPIEAALANGRPEAAVWLADHGARLSLVAAAGVGRLDLVGAWVDGAAQAEREQAFRTACACGRTAVAELLLDRGVDIAASDGQPGLHRAVHGGHVDTVRRLVARGAPLEQLNQYGGTALGQALWSAVHAADDGADRLPVIEALIGAGAVVDPSWSTGIARIDAVLRSGAGPGSPPRTA